MIGLREDQREGTQLVSFLNDIIGSLQLGDERLFKKRCGQLALSDSLGETLYECTRRASAHTRSVHIGPERFEGRHNRLSQGTR